MNGWATSSRLCFALPAAAWCWQAPPFNASCEAFFGSFVGPHPDNCVSLPEACNADEVCNAETRCCEPRIDCRNTPSICTSQQIRNAQSGACEAKPLPPRLPSPSAICLGPGLWEIPSVGNDLYGVGGTGANDVWVVGNLGTAMHYDGNKWAGTLPAGPRICAASGQPARTTSGPQAMAAPSCTGPAPPGSPSPAPPQSTCARSGQRPQRHLGGRPEWDHRD